MAELLSPGVYIEETPAQVQVVQTVSTSNLGIVGFTQRGPTDQALLVSSYEQFAKMFGGFVRESFMPLSAAAYFANGGRRAYVVRVVPADAVAADAKVQSNVCNQQIETGNGILVGFSKTALTTALKVNGGASPIKHSSVAIRWREIAVAAWPAASPTMKRDGVTPLVGDGIALVFEGRVDPTTIPVFDALLPAIGTAVVFKWNALGAKTCTVAYPISGWIGTGTSADGNITLDFRTGRFSLSATLAPTVHPITVDGSAATVTKAAVDNGAGLLTGDVGAGPNTIGYTDGAYAITMLTAPKGPIVVTYTIYAWALNTISKGTWGNNLRLAIVGNADYYDATTASYSKFNVYVQYYNSTSGLYDVVETYEEVSFDDPLSATFFPDVINELSDYMTVVEPGGDEAPEQMAGLPLSMVLAAGDALVASQTITGNLYGAPIQARSVSITWVDALGVTKTVVDNGSGRLVGDVDPTGVNMITYSSGAVNFKTSGPVKVLTVVTATYLGAVVETSHVEDFGDTTAGYTAGTDGTFDSTNYSRNQFSNPTLKATYKGVYALSRIDDIMQVAVPDFAGDQIVTGDLLDYADERASQPAGGDRFIVLTAPKGVTSQEAVDWFRYTLNRYCRFAAMYWPWVRVADPLANNRPLTMPALGHVAGVYARTDANKNVGKAPGGTVDGALKFLVGLETNPNRADLDLVSQNKINALVSSPQTGLAVWGVRTIATEAEWRYINVRRLFMFLEKSVFNSTHWIVFENNGPALWARIKAQLNSFLNGLFNQGYFAGDSPAHAFFVICDEKNNDQSTIDAGQVIIDVGAAPNKPAEFVRFRFQQATFA